MNSLQYERENSSIRLITRDTFWILFFFIFLSMSSIIISFSLMNINNKMFENVFYLPLLTGILYFCAMFFVRNFKDNIANIIIYILYFIRNSLAIYLLSEAKFDSIMPIYSQSQVNKAIVLMLLETIAVFIAVGILGRKNYNVKSNLKSNISPIFKVSIFIFFTMAVSLYIIDPTVRSLYTSIFFGDISTLNAQADIEGSASIYYRIFRQLYPILQLFFPLLIISYSRNKYEQRSIGVLISLVSCLLPLLLVSTQSAYSVVVMTSLLLTTIKIYPKYQKMLFQIIGILGGTITLIFIYQKIQGSNYDNMTFKISSFFQSYFPGVTNISAAFLIPPNFVTSSTVINELITFLPLRSFIISDWDYLNRSQHLFQEVIRNPYQIMSNVSIGFLYLGYLGPIMSVFMVWVANKYYFKKSDNMIIYATNLFVSLFFAVGPIMLNIINVGSRFVEICLWLLLLAYFSENKNIKKFLNFK